LLVIRIHFNLLKIYSTVLLSVIHVKVTHVDPKKNTAQVHVPFWNLEKVKEEKIELTFMQTQLYRLNTFDPEGRENCRCIVWKVGDPCMAFYEDENKWYKAWYQRRNKYEEEYKVVVFDGFEDWGAYNVHCEKVVPMYMFDKQYRNYHFDYDMEEVINQKGTSVRKDAEALRRGRKLRKERGENKYFYDESLYFKEEAIEPDYLDFKYEEDDDICVGEFEEVNSDDGVNVGEFREEEEVPQFPPKNFSNAPKPQFAPVHKKSKFPKPTLSEDDPGNRSPGNGHGSSKGMGLHSNKKPVFAGNDKENNDNPKSHPKGANLHTNKKPLFANSHKKADNLHTNKKPVFARPTLLDDESGKSHKKGDNLHSNKKPVFARPTLKKDGEAEKKSLFPKPTLVEDPGYKSHPKGNNLHTNKKPLFAHASHKKGDNLAMNKKPQFAKPVLKEEPDESKPVSHNKGSNLHTNKKPQFAKPLLKEDEPNASSKKAANLPTNKKPVFAKPEFKEEKGVSNQPEFAPKPSEATNGESEKVQNVNSLSNQMQQVTVGPRKVSPPPGFNATGAPPPEFSKKTPPGFPVTTTTANGWRSPVIVQGGEVVVSKLNPNASSFTLHNANPMMGQNGRFNDKRNTPNNNEMFPPLGNGHNDFPSLGSTAPGNRAVWGQNKGKQGNWHNRHGNGHGNGGGIHQNNPQHRRW